MPAGRIGTAGTWRELSRSAAIALDGFDSITYVLWKLRQLPAALRDRGRRLELIGPEPARVQVDRALTEGLGVARRNAAADPQIDERRLVRLKQLYPSFRSACRRVPVARVREREHEEQSCNQAGYDRQESNGPHTSRVLLRR
jgi:hypothetical protein